MIGDQQSQADRDDRDGEPALPLRSAADVSAPPPAKAAAPRCNDPDLDEAAIASALPARAMVAIGGIAATRKPNKVPAKRSLEARCREGAEHRDGSVVHAAQPLNQQGAGHRALASAARVVARVVKPARFLKI